MSEEKKSKRTLSDRYLYKRLGKYIFEDRATLVKVAGLITLDVFIRLLLPYILAIIIDETIITGDTNQFYVLLIFYLGLFILSRLDQFFGLWFLGIIGEKATYSLRKDTFNHIQYHSQDYFDETPKGDIISRMTNDLNAMQPLLSGQVLYAILSLLTMISMIIVMFTISPILTGIALLAIPLFMPIAFFQKKYIRSQLRTARDTLGKISSVMTENIMGAKVNTSFARSDQNQTEFETVNAKLSENLFVFFRYNAMINPMYEIFSPTMRLLILITGAYLIYVSLGAGVTIGVLFLFLSYVSSFFGPLATLSSLFGQLQTALASFERIVLLIDRKSSVTQKDDAFQLECSQGVIDMQDVSFKYDTSENNILEDFNLKVKENECLAIVGATGSGKTTIANLISRLYEIDRGKILIDSQNIQDVTLESLRDNVGMVLQDPVLVAESIRYNLTYGSDVEDEELEQVLRLIGADFVFDLPKGLDTVVGERGSRLSLGQRQLISFARTLVPNPKILLLDEATSSIDPQAELRIQKAMSKMLESRTSVIIAHRLSTVREADRIIVLEQGRIIEEGTLQELIDLKGQFFELYQLQFERNGKNGKHKIAKEIETK